MTATSQRGKKKSGATQNKTIPCISLYHQGKKCFSPAWVACVRCIPEIAICFPLVLQLKSAMKQPWLRYLPRVRRSRVSNRSLLSLTPRPINKSSLCKKRERFETQKLIEWMFDPAINLEQGLLLSHSLNGSLD